MPTSRKGLRVGLSLAATFLIAALVPTAASATESSSPTKIGAGATTLTLAEGTAKALAGAGVAVAPVDPATAGADGIAFPITKGVLGPKGALIDHSGGLKFSAGGTSVELTDFRVIVVGQDGVLTAKVGEDRLPILFLDLDDAKTVQAGVSTTISGIEATLTGTAAKALNDTFKVSLFSRGLAIGTVKVSALPRELKITGGATSLALSATAAGALKTLGVAASPIKPASANADGSLSFPISRGRVNATTLAGIIRHRGGIKLAAGDVKVKLRRFDIVIDDSPQLTALVGHDRVPILDLDVSGLTKELAADGSSITLGNIKATLTAEAAGALNAAFGVTAFVKGLDFGTATVEAELG